MKIKRTSKQLNQLAKHMEVDKEELAILLYQNYIGMPYSENEDSGLFCEYLEEDKLYEIAGNLVTYFFNREPQDFDLHIIAPMLDEIEMI